jgi:hypothetical protein
MLLARVPRTRCCCAAEQAGAGGENIYKKNCSNMLPCFAVSCACCRVCAAHTPSCKQQHQRACAALSACMYASPLPHPSRHVSAGRRPLQHRRALPQQVDYALQAFRCDSVCAGAESYMGGATQMGGMGSMGGMGGMGSMAGANAAQSFMQMQLMQQQNMMALQQMMMQMNMRPQGEMGSMMGMPSQIGYNAPPGSVISGQPSMMSQPQMMSAPMVRECAVARAHHAQHACSVPCCSTSMHTNGARAYHALRASLSPAGTRTLHVQASRTPSAVQALVPQCACVQSGSMMMPQQNGMGMGMPGSQMGAGSTMGGGNSSQFPGM